ncbi:alpha/beta hydrolase [Paracoccus sp. CPCC 101403]|uniref:Alpha/beta hydrolase n=1 Tax=Paracoccus broussonetiae TaxID=3075834 RepID=A0ABU3EK26_9RHOB|nr:alpha/beta hydrolase [Paracoccus sp. CPCC 101403]MDT1064602.1 alpha/beta hydrolase [Paracoccus sp. CPCC 101403]
MLLSLSPSLSLAEDAAGGLDYTTYQYGSKGGQDLYLDLIVDPSIETEGPRPVILYSFGGGWEQGDRGSRESVDMWRPFLSEGYAIVAIDYRLGIRDAKASGEMTKDNGTEMYLRAIEWGVEDLFDATNFVVDHAADWNVNSEQIVTIGGSSGATNSLVAEYNSANSTPLAQAHLPANFRYAGVISMAGAFWLPKGTPLEFAARPAPIMFFHGAKDWLVTYDEVQADFAGYGPAYYFRKFAGPAYPKWFVDYPQGDHVLAALPLMNRQSEILAFLDRLVIGGEELSIHTVEEATVPSSFEGLMKQQETEEQNQ